MICFSGILIKNRQIICLSIPISKEIVIKFKISFARLKCLVFDFRIFMYPWSIMVDESMKNSVQDYPIKTTKVNIILH
ncbi:MAG: hypothetical protein ACFE9Y_00195 [Promethearchaeota archaeon]